MGAPTSTISEDLNLDVSELLTRLAEMVGRRAYSPRVKLFSKSELASAWGVGETTIDEMVKEKELPEPISIRRRKCWRESTLITWLDKKEGK